ncbi:MAG TPA: LysR family transcriptional regulator, partial [Ilumatobacter sp.]|nr:LysR family transcriptional regulator [Ilumatobacter sp.]
MDGSGRVDTRSRNEQARCTVGFTMAVESDAVDEECSRMVRDELSVMSAFLAVADERSFTKAAKRLGVTQSALSHAIRGLEEQVGVRLLARTTRSVAPTEAGEQLLAELRPALTGIRGALERIGGLRDTPRGRLRLLVPRLAAMTVLGPKLAQFARNYPDVVLDVSTDEARLDLVAGGFDAGVQYGEFIEQDMVAVRVSPDLRPAVVGAPTYFESHSKPASPRDVLNHRCIRFRHRGESVYKWELDKGDESLTISVHGSLLLDDVDLVIQAALDGAGLAWVTEDRIAEHLESGALVRVLDDWCPPFPGYF